MNVTIPIKKAVNNLILFFSATSILKDACEKKKEHMPESNTMNKAIIRKALKSSD
jgi:hypothetical protein